MVTPGRALVLAAVVAVTGCSTVRNIIGMPVAGEPTELKTAEARWLLIKNPRYGSVPSEPEYVWVEEDKVPTTLATLIRGQQAIIAPPEIVAKYGSPPGGGRISPRQGVAYATAPSAAAPAATPAASARPAPSGPVPAAVRTPGPPPPPPTPEPRRGYVVYVDTTRIVVDLVAGDGIQRGSVVSVRREQIPIVHPVTGEVLGQLDEEVGTARITEVREKFSVAEIQSLAPGSRIEPRDRVVPK